MSNQQNSTYKTVFSVFCCVGILSAFTVNAAALAQQIDATQITLSVTKQHILPNKPTLRGSAIVNQSMWVTGSNNAVFLSKDKGKTWLDRSPAITSSSDFRDIEVFDEQHAIVMSVGSGAASTLLETKDGGVNWQLLYQNNQADGFFDAIAFWNSNTGLLLGDPVDGYYVVMKTQDGGKNWRRIAQQKLPAMLTNEAAFAASGNTLIVSGNGMAWITTGGYSASVYESKDFGETWQRLTVPLYDETQTAGGYGLAVNALGQPFVLGGDYQQRSKAYNNMATEIKGQWQRVDAGNRGLRTAMNCYKYLCLATGKTGNDVSYDHGSTWHAIDAKPDSQGNNGFYTLANENNTFLSAGADGRVAVWSATKKHKEYR